MNSKIVFLILHFKVIDETIKCVESILTNYKKDNVDIVIVDNGSNNGTGELLSEKYKKISNIHIIINEENLGFAKGNNIGFSFAKKLGAEYIVMTNNDIIFSQKDFCKLIKSEYRKHNYSVLGPKIIMPSGEAFVFSSRVKSVGKQRLYIYLLYIRLFLAYIHLEGLFNWLYSIKQNKRKVESGADMCKSNVPLYGCCMVFSINYIDKFDGIDDRTFLYCEEDLLYLRLKKNNMLELYDPKLEVIHNHSVSTRSMFKSNRKKEIFLIKNLIKSNKILLEELKGEV